MSKPESGVIPRRHDLDALRAFAMLLGLALHASLSFTFIPWPVQDAQQNPLFAVFFAAIHGFRMPLFFLVSGFFTAMLWRKRGLSALMKHRGKRILLPCLLGLITVVPLFTWASTWALRQRVDVRVESGEVSDLNSAILLGDDAALERLLTGANHQQQLNQALALAAIADNLHAVERLLAEGAELNAPGEDGSTPLHGAALLGRARIVQRLLDAGADPSIRNYAAATPADAARGDWETSRFVAQLLQVNVEYETWRNGQSRVRDLLADSVDGNLRAPSKEERSGSSLRKAYAQMLTSEGLAIEANGFAGWERLHLFQTPVFHHLWFLWFLCWLVVGFAGFAWLADRLQWRRPPTWFVISPIRYAWLLPLTVLPQSFMGVLQPGFGPDTSVGLLPQPHILFYYAIFFGYGALYFVGGDRDERVGSGWPLLLPTAIFFVLPIGLAASSFPLIGAPAQVVYAWLMTFGLMGVFRSSLRRENRVIRYLSDASYWLYLSHLPAVVVAQYWVRDWNVWTLPKFLLVLLVVTGPLLLAYELGVRYTWIGTLLNGRRRRGGSVSAEQDSSSGGLLSDVSERADASEPTRVNGVRPPSKSVNCKSNRSIALNFAATPHRRNDAIKLGAVFIDRCLPCCAPDEPLHALDSIRVSRRRTGRNWSPFTCRSGEQRDSFAA